MVVQQDGIRPCPARSFVAMPSFLVGSPIAAWTIRQCRRISDFGTRRWRGGAHRLLLLLLAGIDELASSIDDFSVRASFRLPLAGPVGRHHWQTAGRGGW